MNYIWILQDHNDSCALMAFKTKQAAIAEAKKYGEGKFERCGDSIDYRPKRKIDIDDPAYGNGCNDPYCTISKLEIR